MKENKPKLLITEKRYFLKKNLKKLNKVFEVQFGCDNLDDLKKKINNFDVIFIRLKFCIQDNLISKNSKLKFIGTPTTGLKHIKLKKKKVKIISLRDCKNEIKKINSTCELTFGLLLSLMRRIPSAIDDVKKKRWDRNSFFGEDLKEKNIGIIGLGRLGKSSKKIAKCFGAKVLTYDKKYDVKSSLDKLLKKSDIILIHVSYDEENYHFFKLNLFKKMKKNCVIVNTSRGEVINQEDLLYALKKKIISGAALDVIDNEYDLESGSNLKIINYLKSHDNLIITPHIGGLTKDSLQKSEGFIVDKLINTYYKKS